MNRARLSSTERAKRTLLTLPQALHHAARDYPGGATAIAAVDGAISASTLNHKLSLTGTNPNHRVNIDELQLILDLTRDPRIVDALLNPIGWVGVDVSELSETDSPQSLLTGITGLLRSENDLSAQLAKALADDHLDDDELAQFELLAVRMLQAVFKLRAVVRLKHEEGRADG
ncbi:phage regulatory CII family protein [Ectopseudomonas alcaliphila]|uniref:Phage regulatory CII family protein n=1 Tax=Ectopseudomonas alcaliphila TaxID=101564 RepID=A0ABU4Q5Z6_9GAMM|nr:phage regulatory CII family protein [Pseudomonas alcaliphila]MDX5994404.1 phage regulatory CII family protein [Pseudomonas alcaliphila]